MNNYVVIDIETSGINPDKDEIIRLKRRNDGRIFVVRKAP